MNLDKAENRRSNVGEIHYRASLPYLCSWNLEKQVNTAL